MTLMKEALISSDTRATRRNIPEDTILHSYRRENLESYDIYFVCYLKIGDIFGLEHSEVFHWNISVLFPGVLEDPSLITSHCSFSSFERSDPSNIIEEMDTQIIFLKFVVNHYYSKIFAAIMNQFGFQCLCIYVTKVLEHTVHSC
jgi:hypothetical protein